MQLVNSSKSHPIHPSGNPDCFLKTLYISRIILTHKLYLPRLTFRDIVPKRIKHFKYHQKECYFIIGGYRYGTEKRIFRVLNKWREINLCIRIPEKE